MIILLDIDGVLVTTPSWKRVEILADGFMKFDEKAVKNLSILYEKTNASIVLTTTHRINFDITQWQDIFKFRGLQFKDISKIDDKKNVHGLLERAIEIANWVENQPKDTEYIIIDDDISIHSLPDTIKQRWIATKPLLGFDNECLEKALSIVDS